MVNPQKRFVGLDVHKAYVMVGAVNRTQEMVLPPRKVSLTEFEGWAKKHLRSTDEVVLEATTGRALALIEGGSLTALRTGAASESGRLPRCSAPAVAATRPPSTRRR